MNLYKIKLADGDSVTYKTEMTLEELKTYIGTNSFIELPRNGTVPYGNGGWRAVPKLASYQTKSIVYVDHDIELEKMIEYNKNIVDSNIDLVREISKYTTNWKMNLWMFFKVGYWSDDEEENCFYDREFLKEILRKCKQYKCKTIS